MAGLKGTIVGHRYELLGVIAQGGQALICRARDRQNGQLVAVKMLTSASAQNPEFAQRLAREQEAMLALAGTSAVAVLDLCRAPSGAPCLVMELLDGNDLEQELTELEARGQRLTLERSFEIFEPIVDTLERAHRAGILHRDLKPANLFVLSEAAGGGVRLLDFGLSRMKRAAPLTALGTVLGSPSYIAPEVWKGQTNLLDHRVDVYSLAVILFRVLTGQLPFGGKSLHDKFLSTTTAPRPKLTTLRPDLPRDIDDWVQQALSIDPNHRFVSVRALWTAMFAALHWTPPSRALTPVSESLANAWRAAAGAFRRMIAGIPTPVPEPMPARESMPAGEPMAAGEPMPAGEPLAARESMPARAALNPSESAEWLTDSVIFELDEENEDDALNDVLGDAPPSSSPRSRSSRTSTPDSQARISKPTELSHEAATEAAATPDSQARISKPTELSHEAEAETAATADSQARISKPTELSHEAAAAAGVEAAAEPASEREPAATAEAEAHAPLAAKPTTESADTEREPASGDDEPEITVDETAGADDEPEMAGDETARAGDEPQMAGDEPTSAASEPELAVDQPNTAANEPEMAGEQPKMAAADSEMAGEQPKMAAADTEMADNEPTSADDEPEVAAREPASADDEPEVAANQPAKADNETTNAVNQPTEAKLVEEPEPAPAKKTSRKRSTKKAAKKTSKKATKRRSAKEIAAEREAQREAKGRAEGELSGAIKAKADAILTVLDARGLPAPPEVRELVETCTDLAQLDSLLRRAALSPTAEGLFD